MQAPREEHMEAARSASTLVSERNYWIGTYS